MSASAGADITDDVSGKPATPLPGTWLTLLVLAGYLDDRELPASLRVVEPPDEPDEVICRPPGGPTSRVVSRLLRPAESRRAPSWGVGDAPAGLSLERNYAAGGLGLRGSLRHASYPVFDASRPGALKLRTGGRRAGACR